MISCPGCHKLIPSDSRFCFYCGSDITQKKESKADGFLPHLILHARSRSSRAALAVALPYLLAADFARIAVNP